MHNPRRALRGMLLTALLAGGLPTGAMAQDYNQEATQLCSIVAGSLIAGQYPAQSVFGQSAWQQISQQTQGTGRFPQLAQLGSVAQVSVVNPHIDQDQQFGQLFHFWCSTMHPQNVLLQWELKYAPSTQKVEYWTVQSAQQQQPRGGQTGGGQTGGTQPWGGQTGGGQTGGGQTGGGSEPSPWTGGGGGQTGGGSTPTSQEEACQRFPGMC